MKKRKSKKQRRLQQRIDQGDLTREEYDRLPKDQKLALKLRGKAPVKVNTDGKVHRPTTINYTPEWGQRVCHKIASTRKPIQTLYKTYSWFPHPSTLQRWRRTHDDFREMWIIAQLTRAQGYADDQIHISDEIDSLVRDSDEHPAKLNAMVQAAKLRVDSRRWAASKLSPGDFGEKLTGDFSVKHDTEGNLDSLVGELADLASRRRKRDDNKQIDDRVEVKVVKGIEEVEVLGTA